MSCLKLNPGEAACLYNLGYMENKQGNLEEAGRLLTQALQSNPKHGDALYELATVKMAERNTGSHSPAQAQHSLSSKPAQAFTSSPSPRGALTRSKQQSET